ncbi:hypothetical protein SF1_19220 [Sphingobacterium faecium NBRC 15299]|uniref:hypothetical protein n=1 Tax=Sphingobacterium faecium TaxID=34087 RepID=UPI000D36BC00|nr:hypothetical protein [Sphingobacterium faecium]PTX09433.1 hypothetical protein C8N37_10661 [Sphingobacterium faecium]GEM63940.1 hypothetical protein SF1_19220 [Sphingobacterium faecium NBRC 15299]
MKNTFYPKLPYPVADLSAYTLSVGIFFISLKTEEIIRFEPEDQEHFKCWLEKFQVRNIKKDLDKL